MDKKRWIPMAALIILPLFFLFSLLFFVKEEKGILIERNPYGGGSREETIYVDDEPVTFTVGEVEYTEEELEKAMDEGFLCARESVLAENESFSEVRTDLNFSPVIPEGLEYQWISSEPEVILSDGQVKNQEFEEGEEVFVTVTLVLSYGESIEQEDMVFRVMSPLRDDKTSLLLKIKKYMEETEKNTRNQKSFLLPETLETAVLSKEPGTSPWALIFLPFSVAAAGWILRKQREEDQVRRRADSLKEDYPVFVNQIILYLGAGMNIKTVLETICHEYEEASEEKENRPLYEELNHLRNEMNAGLSQTKAYENFGKRTGDQSYVILMSLLLQNLKKGNDGLIAALCEEEEASFERRIDQARRRGEQAGTKLLFPMLILLVVVIVIVMAPALLQFRVY